MSEKVVVIGSGFSGLTAATHLAEKGFDVTLLEKNPTLGGRARKFEAEGFTFDMGPSWYWMPEVFDQYFKKFGYETSDFYDLKRLSPSYRVFYNDEPLDIPSSMDELRQMFEDREVGAGKKLDEFMKEAKYKYEMGMTQWANRPSLSPLEFMEPSLLKQIWGVSFFKSFRSHAKQFFKDEKLLQLIEFPVLFLGAKPQNTPALYSLMNYADMGLGTWYPMGGMHKIIDAFVSIAKDKGVDIVTDAAVTGFEYNGKYITGVITGTKVYSADSVISSADYRHTESILPKDRQSYSDSYWESRKMSPSSLLFYLGVKGKVNGIKHHNLFFDTDFEKHSEDIYDTPKWTDDPLFYVCTPSKTDNTVAPEGDENIFILMPLAAGVEDTEELREKFYHKILTRLEKWTGESVRDRVVYKRSYCINDFTKDYNAFKGNAYGLSNTLLQTAFLKPKMKSKKINNLVYTGQLTVPGPGVPPSIISGEMAADLVQKHLAHETII